MNKIIRRYIICVAFTLELAILVLFSEILRMAMFGFPSNSSPVSSSSILVNMLTFVLFAFVVVPFSLMFLWHMNPILMNKLFDTLGLTEKMLDKKGKSEDKAKEKEEKS